MALAAAALMAGLAAAWVLVAMWVHRFGLRDGAGSAEALVVLGAKVRADGTPSAALEARVRHAMTLYQRGLAPLVVFSGGPREGQPAEALVAWRLAERLGLPESSRALEEASGSTRQNAALSAALLSARGLRRVVVVTDGFHAFRARQWFRRSGLAVAVSPAPVEGRGLSWTQRGLWTFREAAALLFDPRLLFARRPQSVASATR
jgi:uncharacterized SAM-binding protein YcdF (DUF218 family)